MADYAIYRGHLATVTECMGVPEERLSDDDIKRAAAVFPEMPADWCVGVWRMDGVILDHELWVSFFDPDLNADPTYDQIQEARR